MNWTEPTPPTANISSYDHVICETPLGQAKIEWKSWKDSPSYDIELDGKWIGCEYDLEKAKEEVRTFLGTTYYKLKIYLELNE